MAYGGGTWVFQNKDFPGAFVNFTSVQKALNSVSDRGYGALALDLDWGLTEGVMEVTTEDFQKDSLALFGYEYTHEKLKGLRDFFKNAKVGYIYRLNSGGTKASNDLAEAKYIGVRGNDISITVSANVDEPSKFDVITYIDGVEVDRQKAVATAKDLKPNEFVTFKSGASLSAKVGVKLTNGANGTSVSGTNHQKALESFEQYYFNTLACVSTDSTTKDLYIAYTKRMRDEVGAKFQLVVHKPQTAPDYEGIIALDNDVVDTNVASLVYWVAGASCGCPINRTNTNKTYDGEFVVTCEPKQTKLAKAIREGKFVFHKVGKDVRVLKDVNSFTSFTLYKNRDFAQNQVIRVLDQIGNDIARLFYNNYLGKVQNNTMGRLAFYNDILDFGIQLERVEAIQDFKDKDVRVEAGRNKEDVYVELYVNPTMAMEKLYMSVVVR